MSVNFGTGGFGTFGQFAMNTGFQNPNAQCGTVFTSFKEKYGCEDCFRRQPTWVESTVTVLPVPPESVKQSFWQRICHRILGC